MKLIKIFIILVIMALTGAASAQNNDFRLKWAENDGTEWFDHLNAKKDGLFTLVSENSLSEGEPQYAKAIVFPSEKGVVFAVAGVDFTGSTVATIKTDKESHPFSTTAPRNKLYVKYADFSNVQNPVMQKIGCKATIFAFSDAALDPLSNSKEFTFCLYDKDKRRWDFKFSTTKTIAELCE